jgi:dihydroorotate dehydrogenase electron transfer subunit
MTSPLHAAYYPDRAVQQTVEIVENVRLAKDTYRVRFHSPTIARRIVPGQFLMLRLSGLSDPLIGRPLALYDTIASASGEPDAVDVVYLVKGKLTGRLWQMQPGQKLDVWGPLGNGFGCTEYSVLSTQYSLVSHDSPTNHSPLTTHHSLASHLIMVAGGIGQTPFLALAKEALGQKKYGDPPRDVPRAERVTFCYGARTADYLAGLEDFAKLGIDIRIATDDGTRGHHGFVTDVLKQVLAENQENARIVCCGPESMMHAASKIARESRIPCEVSLETPMACGIGICFTCVAKVRQADGWDYKRTCVEGPVFDAELIEW